MFDLRRAATLACALFTALLTVLAPAALPVAHAATTSAPATQPGDHLMIGVLPDTQFHSRYATEETGNPYMATYGSEPYDTQTRWLADSAAEYGTEFVMHLGDVVDQADHQQQWDVADRAMQNLEDAGLPYSILAGNHDVGEAFANYQATFPVSRQETNSTYQGSDPTGLHNYHIIDHNGQPILVLALSWDADQAAFDWANSVLDANPDVPTIVTSHQLINISQDATAPEPTDFGERVWNNVIKNHDQVFLTYNGHHHGAMTWERTNDAGNPVLQVLIDHQMAYMGGNGLLAMLDLDFTNNTVSQTTLSPWVAEKPADTLQSLDVAYMNGQYSTFTWDFNFKERFPNLKVSSDVVDSPTTKLREWASNIEVPQASPLTPAADADDYVAVDGTVAHWKMPVDKDAEVAAVGAEIADVAGGNTFTRAPLNIDGAQNAQESDVTFSASHSQYSSNFGSVCFANADKTTKRTSYFTTAEDAAINSEEFPNGYTMETFVKIDPSYDVEKNNWMAWLGRDGKRSDVEGYTNTEGDEPPLAWAFSTLNEVQFSFIDSTPAREEVSLWSGEIVNYTDWMHLVVTNDPETKMSTLYVDGVPMLRNGPNTLGLAADDAGQWILGSGTYAGVRDSGFVGCVGETRIVDHVLNRDEWLTARSAAPVTEAPVTEAPTTEAPETEAPVTEEPAAEVPETEAPATEVPAAEVPETEAPVTEAPATEEPGAEAPTAEGDDEAPVGETSAPADPADQTGTDPADQAGTDPADQAGTDRALPRTGVNVGVSLAIAAVLLAAGAGAIFAARRKR